MKRYLTLFAALLLLAGCRKETEKTTVTEVPEEPAKPATLSFAAKTYAKKSTICKKECSHVTITVPEAVNGSGKVADSINKALFEVARSIVYFGEKPTNAKNYDELIASFIKSYDDLAKKYPEEAEWSWEAKVKAGKNYQSDNIINFTVNSYMFTGGAHGYEGNRSVIIDAKTGANLKRSDILKDEKAFAAYAEKAFRKKFGIAAGKPINSTGLMFENNRFALPQNIFYTNEGLMLLYNPVEVTSFAEGPKKVVLPYNEVEAFLKVK